MKPYTWKDLLAVVRKIAEDYFAINDFMIEFTKKFPGSDEVIAAALSVAKWSPENRRWLSRNHRYDNTSSCGLCTLFRTSGCRDCPLSLKGHYCMGDYSLWWGASHGKNQEYSDKLYWVLVEIYRGALEEYEKGGHDDGRE